MSEQARVDGPADAPPEGLASESASESASEPASEPASEQSVTGLPAVDQVLRQLDGLEDLPVSEHLPAFERAHGALRAALDDELDGRPEPGPAEPA
jgi:hypothetical protein